MRKIVYLLFMKNITVDTGNISGWMDENGNEWLNERTFGTTVYDDDCETNVCNVISQ